MRGRIRSTRLGILLNAGIGITFIIAAVIVVISVNYSMRRQALNEAQSKARIILDRNFSTHTYFSQIMKPSIFAWSEPFRSKDYFDHTWMSSTYAVREIEKYFKTLNPSGYYFKDAAINARSPENEADEYERAFLEKLGADKNLDSESTVRKIDGKPYLIVLRRSEVMEASCLRCHSNPKDAPKGLTDYYGSERSFNRKEGDVASAVSFHIPLSEAYAAANIFSLKLSAILLSVLLCLFTIQYLFYRRYLLKPLDVIQEKATQIATHEEHLGEQIILPLGRELNELAIAFNEMSVKLRHDRDHLEELVDQRTEEVRKEKYFAESLVKTAQTIVLVLDTKGYIVSINPYMEQISGYTFEEVQEKDWFSTFLPERDQNRTRELYSKAIADIQTLGNINPIVTKDGREIDIEWYDKTLKDESGNITGLLSIGQDITERKCADEKLRRSEENFHHSLDDSPMGVRIVTVEGETIYANRAILDIYDYDSMEDLKTTPVEKCYTPESHADFLIRREKRQQGVDVPSEYTINIIRKDGEVRHLLVLRREILWDGERQFQVLYNDITERKRAEEELRESEERLRTIVEASLDAIIAVNTEGRLVLFNGAAQELFQYSEEEALNQPVDILLREETGKIHQERLERFLNRGVGQCGHIGRRTERPFRRKDGSLFEGEVSMSGGRLNGLRLVVLAIHDITSRKKTEEALRESEKKYRELANLLPQIVYETDEHANFTFVNQTSCSLTGYTQDDFKGLNALQMVAPIDRDRVKNNILKVLQGETITGNEYLMQRKDGSTFPAIFHSIPIIKENKIVGFRGFAVDITERKQAEEALSARERSYRALAENLPGIVYRVHIREKGRMQFFNNMLVTLAGYNEKELIEGEVCSIDPLIVAEDRDRVIAEVKAAIKDNRGFSIEYRITHKDGTSRFFIERGRPIFGNDELHCIDGIILDITERKRAEEALRESEEQYRNLFENAAEAIYVVQDGKLVFLNPMTATMTGYSGEELMARPFPEFIHPDDRDMVIDRHVRRIKGEELPHIYSFRIIHRDGNVRWVELNTVLINWKGKTATLNFLSDITERKQIELQLKESEEIMRYIIKHDPNAIAVYDRNLQYIAVSNRYLQDYNVKESDIIGKHHYEVFPEMPQRWKDVHARCLAGAIERNDDDYFERPDGSITYNRWECRPWHRPDGEIGGIITYTEVTTERKKSEEELRTSRSQLRALAARLQQIREYERIMIAREIHDEMGGGLTGLKMDLSWLLRKMSDADPGEARVALMDKIHTSNASIDQMIHVVRRISTDLRPSVLDDLGLIAALEWQLSEFTSRTEIPHEFATTIEYVNMEENTAIAVFRIFQEALTNVMRHSRATKVVVVLREDERSLFGDESLVLEIRDNGKGITEEEIMNKESLGLLGMKERAMAFGGELSIRGESGGGTAVVLKIPKKQGEAL